MDFPGTVRQNRAYRRAQGEAWLQKRIDKALKRSAKLVVRDEFPDARIRVPRRIVNLFGSKTSQPLEDSARRLVSESGASARIVVLDRTPLGARSIQIIPR